jgi:hypothetical protein
MVVLLGLLLVLLMALRSPAPIAFGGPDAGGGPVAKTSYGQVPLAFRPSAAGTGYFASTSAGTIELSEIGATIVPVKGAPIEMSLAAGADGSAPHAIAKLPGVVNDLRGDDASKWRTDIPTFARVRYPDVYPGTSMDFHGTSGTLEYDFNLSAGADPQRIAVDFHGAALRVNESGALIVGSGRGAMRQAPPVAYQQTAFGRVPVDAAFRIHGDRVGFALGSYDHSIPLVIDPLALAYSTYLGGNDFDQVDDLAVDSTGHAYVVGYTASTNFPTSGGGTAAASGSTDAIVTKFNPAGGAVDYSTLIGGTSGETGESIAIDSSGNAYITGQTRSSDFPAVGSGYRPGNDPSGFGDVYVAKLNAAGNALVYTSVFGGSLEDRGYGIALDSSNSVYLTGFTESFFSSGPGSPQVAFPTVGAPQPGDPGDTSQDDAFVSKLAANGQSLVYSTYLGGDGAEWGNDIDVDAGGRAYVSGFTTSNNLPTTASKYEGRSPGGTSSQQDAFLTVFNSAGSGYDYSTYLGGDGNDSANGVAVGPGGDAYITGGTTAPGSGTNDFDLKDSYETRPGGVYHGDLFVSKIDPSQSGTSSLVYSSLIGGSGLDGGQTIDVGADGSAYVGGGVYDGGADPYDRTADALPGTGGTALVTKLSPAGNVLTWSTLLPTGSFGGSDTVFGIAADPSGTVYIAGTTFATTFPTTTGAFQEAFGGSSRDGFISKITSSAGPPDTDPPETAITGGPGAGSTVTSSSVTFNFGSDEASSTFECSYDSAVFAACSSPGPGMAGSDTRTLANGTHTFQVRATDAALNVDATPDTRTFTVNVGSTPPPPDILPPETTITEAPPASLKSKKLPVSVSASFSSSEPGSSFSCKVDGGSSSSCSSPATFSLGKGNHTISITATDAAGNADASPATAQVTVTKKKKKKHHKHHGH